jgi:Secretion system C-terminal sorting domain
MIREYLVVSLAVFSISAASHAQWMPEGHVVCDTSGNQAGLGLLPKLASDGRGGVFVCWADQRTGSLDLYLQHVDSSGNDLLPYQGVSLVDAPGTQVQQTIIPDGERGAFVSWRDDSGADNYAYAQRIDSFGQPMWTPNGVKAANYGGLWIRPARTERGELVLAWDATPTVVAQKLDSSGQQIWGDSGVVLTTRGGGIYPEDVGVTTDGRGGVIVAWTQGPNYDNGVAYVQRLDSSGKSMWQDNGIALCQGGNYILGVAITSDTSGGAIITWVNQDQILQYVQRVDSSGAVRWQSGGVALGDAARGGGRRITADDHGGAFVGHGAYLQHVNAAGTKLWTAGGVPYTVGTTLESSQAPSPDGGAWNFWEDWDNGPNMRIAGQWIDGTGSARWGEKGIQINNTVSSQVNPNAVADGRGHVFVCWEDDRRGNDGIYLSKFDTMGIMTAVRSRPREYPPGPVLEQNYPNPFNPRTIISYSLAHQARVLLEVFDGLGRKVRTLVDNQQSAGKHEVTFDAQGIASGLYIYQVKANGVTIARKMLLIH